MTVCRLRSQFLLQVEEVAGLTKQLYQWRRDPARPLVIEVRREMETRPISRSSRSNSRRNAAKWKQQQEKGRRGSSSSGRIQVFESDSSSRDARAAAVAARQAAESMRMVPTRSGTGAFTAGA